MFINQNGVVLTFSTFKTMLFWLLYTQYLFMYHRRPVNLQVNTTSTCNSENMLRG